PRDGCGFSRTPHDGVAAAAGPQDGVAAAAALVVSPPRRRQILGSI
ncbi:unnamed protein product, partial [Urochloa humidicola]